MDLTVGAMLQGNKYVIQGVLNRTDFGITYQAIHTYLNQTVVLQTLAKALQQRSDFAQLRQQFVTGVRSLASRPEFPRVLDCFEEEGFPVVVLEWATNRVVPKLSDWLVLPPEERPAHSPDGSTAPAVAPPAAPVVNPPVAPVVAPAVESTGATAALPIANAEPDPGSHPVDPAAIAAQPPIARSSRFSSKAKRGLPTAIAITALIGSCIGAGMGVALRFQPLRHHSASGGSSGVQSSLFSHEETFPPQQDWPISENPVDYPPTTSAEEPVYRVNSAPSYWGVPPTDYSAPKPYTPPAIPAAPAEKAPSTPKVETKSVVSPPSYSQPDQSTIDTPPVRSTPVPRSAAPVAPAPDLPEPINVAPPAVEMPSPIAPKRLSTANPAIVNQ